MSHPDRTRLRSHTYALTSHADRTHLRSRTHALAGHADSNSDCTAPQEPR